MWGFNKSLVVVLLLCVCGCAYVPSPEQRTVFAENLTKAQGWLRLDIDAPPFVLRAYLPEDVLAINDKKGSNLLTVYIEGDGYAWKTRFSPSSDPTPVNPIGLKLALNQPGGNVAYLARPCQFTIHESNASCNELYWTSHRYSPEVVNSCNEAIDELMLKTESVSLRLVGYSGGGAIASLIAARRHDVSHLITVAGNLDHQLWTQMHSVKPLVGSLNPVDFTKELRETRQTHVVGGEDQIIPLAIAERFESELPQGSNVEIKVVPDNNHGCCWEQSWSKVFSELVEDRP